MTFISLTFVALLAFGSLVITQAEECGAYNSDLWKEGMEASEGTCSRRPTQNVVEDSQEEGEENTKVAGSSFFDIIQTVINFVWMIFKWYTNMNG
nr:uncharacterized protein LOC108077652 isoform X2 [Drosophila kikkawai]